MTTGTKYLGGFMAVRLTLSVDAVHCDRGLQGSTLLICDNYELPVDRSNIV